MLTVELYAADGSFIGHGEIPPSRAYPPAVAEFKQGGPPLFFLRRGRESVGDDAEKYDVYEVPVVKLTAKG